MCINKFKFTINGVPVIILVVFFYRHEKILKLKPPLGIIGAIRNIFVIKMYKLYCYSISTQNVFITYYEKV